MASIHDSVLYLLHILQWIAIAVCVPLALFLVWASGHQYLQARRERLPTPPHLEGKPMTTTTKADHLRTQRIALLNVATQIAREQVPAAEAMTERFTTALTDVMVDAVGPRTEAALREAAAFVQRRTGG